MFSLNISCSSCKAVFKSSDIIYSTSCGHIYHIACINRWQSQMNTCPVCRSYTPAVHKICLNFDDSHDYNKFANQLKAKLDASDEKIKDIKSKMDKKEQKIDQLKRLYNISEQWRAELQNKIQILTNEFQIKNDSFSKEMTLKFKEIESLKRYIQDVQKAEGALEIYEKIKKLEDEQKQSTSQLMAENLKLKESLVDSEASKMILNHKIQMQEQRLKHITLELQKQITASVQSEINNSLHKTAEINKSMHKAVDTKSNQTLKQSNKRTWQIEITQPKDFRVLIKDFPKAYIVQPLSNSVISLASKMSLSLTSEDFINVNILEPKGLLNKSDKVILLVEFKDIDGKIQFLKNRNLLKLDSSVRCIEIKEYIDEVIYPIFMYANRNLRDKGYKYIYCKDGQVFAKKSKDETEEIAIQNRNDVDRLLSDPMLIDQTADGSRIRNKRWNARRQPVKHLF